MRLEADTLRGRIPRLRDTVALTRLEQGYSADAKFAVTRADGGRWVLRVFPCGDLERHRAEHGILRRLRDGGARVPEPVEVGTVEGWPACYSIVSFIEGTSAQLALAALPEAAQ